MLSHALGGIKRIAARYALHGAFAPTTSPFPASRRLLISGRLAIPDSAKVCSSGASRVYWVASNESLHAALARPRVKLSKGGGHSPNPGCTFTYDAGQFPTNACMFAGGIAQIARWQNKIVRAVAQVVQGFSAQGASRNIRVFPVPIYSNGRIQSGELHAPADCDWTLDSGFGCNGR